MDYASKPGPCQETNYFKLTLPRKVVKSRHKLVDEYQNHLVEVQLDNEHLTKTNGGDVYIFEPVCTLIYSNLYNQFLFAPSHQIVFTSSKTISQQFLKL